MEREFASPRRTKLADHQRPGCRGPFDQFRADRRPPGVPKITKRSSPFHHDNPPFKTGSENQRINRLTSKLCERGSP